MVEVSLEISVLYFISYKICSVLCWTALLDGSPFSDAFRDPFSSLLVSLFSWGPLLLASRIQVREHKRSNVLQPGQKVTYIMFLLLSLGQNSATLFPPSCIGSLENVDFLYAQKDIGRYLTGSLGDTHEIIYGMLPNR